MSQSLKKIDVTFIILYYYFMTFILHIKLHFRFSAVIEGRHWAVDYIFKYLNMKLVNFRFDDKKLLVVFSVV